MIGDIFADSRNQIWLGAKSSLVLFDGDRWRQYRGQPWYHVRAFSEDDRGRIWLAGFEGYGFLDGSTWTFIPNEASEIRPESMMFDNLGNLWMGSWNHRNVVKFPRMILPTHVEASRSAGEPPSSELLQNCPNPFNASTLIRFSVAAHPEKPAGRVGVVLEVRSGTGALVRQLVADAMAPGTYSVAWDGRNGDGESVASGVYVYRLRAGERSVSRKALLLR